MITFLSAFSAAACGVGSELLAGELSVWPRHTEALSEINRNSKTSSLRMASSSGAGFDDCLGEDKENDRQIQASANSLSGFEVFTRCPWIKKDEVVGGKLTKRKKRGVAPLSKSLTLLRSYC